MFAALAEGVSEITGLLEGEDVLNTAKACAALGADIRRNDGQQGLWRVHGVGQGGLKQPGQSLDFGNSGTGSRLMMGMVAGHPISAVFDGDVSLRSRPMERVLKPLRQMGARTETGEGGRMPVTLHGGALKAIRYAPPEASAQVKSAVLLAGLMAEGVTEVAEARMTRDHTERMLRNFGVAIETKPVGQAGAEVRLAGGQSLQSQRFATPGDPSSAAFLLAAAALSPRADVTVQGVLANPTRDGFVRALLAMGADLAILGDQSHQGAADRETSVDLSVRSSGLKCLTLPQDWVPAMIDELPIFAVCAAFADGETRVSGAEELRVKESDRIKATVDLLRVNGVAVEETHDGFVIQGCGAEGVPGGGHVETRHDHRIAMAALVMGTASRRPVSVDSIAMIATSYPEFIGHMRGLGAEINEG